LSGFTMKLRWTSESWHSVPSLIWLSRTERAWEWGGLQATSLIFSHPPTQCSIPPVRVVVTAVALFPF